VERCGAAKEREQRKGNDGGEPTSESESMGALHGTFDTRRSKLLARENPLRAAGA